MYETYSTCLPDLVEFAPEESPVGRSMRVSLFTTPEVLCKYVCVGVSTGEGDSEYVCSHKCVCVKGITRIEAV